MINARQIKHCELAQPDSQIAAVGRRAPVIADGFHFLPALAPRHYVAQEVFAARSEDVSGADDDRAGVGFLRFSFTFEFVLAVDADRPRLIALRVKAFFLTVEDVVG